MINKAFMDKDVNVVVSKTLPAVAKLKRKVNDTIISPTDNWWLPRKGLRQGCDNVSGEALQLALLPRVQVSWGRAVLTLDRIR